MINYIYKIFMARLIAIDFGEKYTGLAHTDPNQMVASGLKTLPTNEVIPFLRNYCDNEQVEAFVIGEPIQKNGLPSEVESLILKFITSLKKEFPSFDLYRHNERYTSKMAFKVMIDAGLKKKQRQDKRLIDQISSTIILQSYLEYKSKNK
jgi:putative Holliday junction resolvase